MTLTRWQVLPTQRNRNSFDRFVRDWEDLRPQSWTPPVDVYEDDDNFTLSLEAPGMKREDFSVKVEHRQLTISGERAFAHEDRRDNFHRIERRYGSFSRTFTLHKRVDVEAITATYRDGILTVTLPKLAEEKPRTIDVSVGE